MGRAATTFGTPDGNPCVLDRSASGTVSTDERAAGTPAVRPARTEPLLPGSAATPPARLGSQEPPTEPAVALHQLWFELPSADRQRFGHCFSFMVLKALGLRPCPLQEVEA